MPRPQIGEERRDEILAAFEQCVIRKGLSKTTLKDVADEAGQPRSLVRYFIGNRSDMVDALIARILQKGEEQFSEFKEHPDMSASLFVTYLFDETFADETTNFIINELAYLATKDDELKKRLTPLYLGIIEELSIQMEKDGYGSIDLDRKTAAYSIISLAFGQAIFSHMGLLSELVPDPRIAAQAILENLKS